MKKGAVVMHPGPINRGIELDGGGGRWGAGRSCCGRWTNGVAVRMMVLERAVLAGPGVSPGGRYLPGVGRWGGAGIQRRPMVICRFLMV